MYESTFDLKSRPFASTPQVECYFPASAIEQARQTLARTIDRAEGPGFLTGPAGTGKSLVCQLLAEEFRGKFVVAMLSTAQLTSSRALLQNILFELGLPYHDGDESDLRLRLTDYLEPSAQCPHGMLLLVDEAHMLPLAVLEEIRLLTNMARQGAPRVRLVLAGGPDLEEQFTSPKLTSFSQRIAARCYLHSFNREETSDYIKHHIRHAGGDAGGLFTPAAIAAVYSATDGIPRLVNQVCDHALMLASLGGHPSISEDAVQEAWSDLQQLPTPWQRDEQPQSVIEFGSLSDDDTTYIEDPVAAIEDIQQQINNVTEDAAAEDDASAELPAPQPAVTEPAATKAAAKPATKPVAPVCVEAFTEDYEEEELVIDHYSAMTTGFPKATPAEESPEADEAEVQTEVAIETSAEIESHVEIDSVDEQPALTVCKLPETECSHEDETPALECVSALNDCDSEAETAEAPATVVEPEPAEVEHYEEAETVTESVDPATDEAEYEADDEAMKTVELPEGFPVIGYVADETSGELADPADDPVMPEFAPQGGPDGPGEDEEQAAEQVQTGETSHNADDESVSLVTIAGADAEPIAGEVSNFALPAHDDRDLIIVDEENASTDPPAFRGRARRQEYAQLFAKLRRG